MSEIAFATYSAMPDMTDDDRLVANLLQARGVSVSAAVWDALRIDWSRFARVVIRSTWDYHLKPDRYAEWLRTFLPKADRLKNPPQAVLENIDKRYLLKFEQQGIEVVPTHFQAAGDEVPLRDVLSTRGWDYAVVKPAISASGWGAWRTSHATANDVQLKFAEQLRNRDLLIQPFIPEVTAAGEWSMMFFDGQYSHAVLKRPAPGDFRVQQQFGGTAVLADPAKHLIAGAQKAVAATGHRLLYARADCIEQRGRFVLMELEINEPFLFLSASDEAAQRFADAIMDEL